MKQLSSLLAALLLCSASAVAQDNYPVNFDKNTLTTANTDRAITSITFTSSEAAQTISGWNTDAPLLVYTDATDKMMTFGPGESIVTSVSARNTEWMYGYLYIDYNQNGQFDLDQGELVSSFTNQQLQAQGWNYNPLPSFTIPTDLTPGDYRVRFKTDWDCNDPGGRYGDTYTDNLINDNRGQIIDFTLRVATGLKSYKVVAHTTHCNLYLADGVSQLPTKVRGDLTFKVVPMEGYVLKGTFQYKIGTGKVNRISAANMPSDGIITIPNVTGNLTITATYQQGPEAVWTCIFNDEFNETLTGWDAGRWTTQAPSANVVWARFNSQNMDDGVVVQHDGYLTLSSRTTGSNTMVTGNLITKGLFDFTYGRVEARCFVHPHSGNFPAFWLMPAHQKPNYSGEGTWGGWPYSGEIDIMEQVNNENTAHHTIHSHWANGPSDGGLSHSYQKTSSEWVDMSRWHIYALEWDEEQLRWYVDGRHVHTYDRNPDADNDEDRQWPFDQPFYIIINQSVGRQGAWAWAPDFNHTYSMDVDYVRVYQRCIPSAVSDLQAENDIEVRPADGRIIVTTVTPTPVRIVTLSGACVHNAVVDGTESFAVSPGLYIVAGKKIMVR